MADAPIGTAGAVLRQATRADIPGIWDVRYAVQENTLRRGVIHDEDVRAAIEDIGRGWVVAESAEPGARVLAFAIGVMEPPQPVGKVWALFVHPDAQGRGYGHALHDVMLAWLLLQGAQRLWLGTGPGTQALGFYLRRGWQLSATPAAPGEEDLELEWPVLAPGGG